MVRRRLLALALPLLAGPILSGCARIDGPLDEPQASAAARFAAALEAADPVVGAAIARMDGFERMAAREGAAIGFAVDGGPGAAPGRFTAPPAGAAEAAGRAIAPAFAALGDYAHILAQATAGLPIQAKPSASGEALAAAAGDGLRAVQAAGGGTVAEPVQAAGLAGIAALADLPEVLTKRRSAPDLVTLVAEGQPQVAAVTGLLRAVIGAEAGQGTRAAIRARREGLNTQQGRFLAALRTDRRIGPGERYSIFRSIAELRDSDPAQGTLAALVALIAAVEQAHAALAAGGPDAEAKVAGLEIALARLSTTAEGSRRG